MGENGGSDIYAHASGRLEIIQKVRQRALIMSLDFSPCRRHGYRNA